MPAAEWAAARAQMMLDPTAINLNTGSFGPLPQPVFDRVTALRHDLAAEPMDFLIRKQPALLWHRASAWPTFSAATSNACSLP